MRTGEEDEGSVAGGANLAFTHARHDICEDILTSDGMLLAFKKTPVGGPTRKCEAGRKRSGGPGGSLDPPPGLFFRTSIACIWRILSAFLLTTCDS